jgi:hypothetical protein
VKPADDAVARSWKGYSPRLLSNAGIQVDRHDFWVRDAVTNECRLMTDAEWNADVGAASVPPLFTEDEIKDVLTSLYQDGHVDLRLADRVAALLHRGAPDLLAVAHRIKQGFTYNREYDAADVLVELRRLVAHS